MDISNRIQLVNCHKTPLISFLCDELNHYLSEMFSVSSLLPRQFICRIIPDSFRYDGYSISYSDETVCISSGMERGLLHGTYALLHRLGCSFLFPGHRREIIPRLVCWPLPENFSITEEPMIEFRGICLYNTTSKTVSEVLRAVDWMAKNRFNFLLTSINRLDDTGCDEHAILWSEIGDRLLPELNKRGIEIDMSEHSTDYFFPREKLFAAHPEWFALNNGIRTPGQICYSNKEAVKEYAKSLTAFAEKNREFRFMGIWPLDGGGYCECEKCKDSQTIYKANSYIAEEIHKVRPDLIVEHLAYTPRSFPRPLTPMPPNMCVLVCHLQDSAAYEWAVSAKNAQGAFYFDYMTADHYRYRSDVFTDPYYCRNTVNTLAGYNYRGVVSLYLPVECWFQSSLNFWYLSRLYYDPAQPLSRLHELLADELFGSELREEGAEALIALYDNLLDRNLWSDMSHKHDWYCDHITGRNHILDRQHAKAFDLAYSDVSGRLNRLLKKTSAPYAANIKRLIQVVHLHNLYFHCIDQYDAEKDKPQKAEPYFDYLSQLNKEEDSPFITEEYARWRVVGRDNVFDPANVNTYQPSSE